MKSELNLVSHEWYYKYKKEWQPLPEWALRYILFGKHIAQRSDLNLVIGLSIPIRYYAAILISLGISLAQVDKPIVKSDLLDHFIKLCNLPKGTPISYHEGNRLRRGSLEGCTEQDGIPRIKIHLGKTEKQYIPSSMANQIQLSHEDLPSPNLRKRSKILKCENSLLYAFMNSSSAITYQMESRLECTIMGDKKRLLQEACESLAIQLEDKSLFPGKIQDLLRVCQLKKAQEGYRADIQSDRTKNLAPKNNEVPPIAIFDSASGFLKWRDNWQQSQWIVLLDQTETAFEEAVNTLNQESLNYLSDNGSINLPEPPQNVSMLVYKRAKP